MSKTPKVLVVEDDDSAFMVLQMLLEAIPCQIERAKGGQTALDLLRNDKFDAAILDLMLPEMSGEDLLKLLNEDPRFKGFPILVNSTSADLHLTKEKIKACTNLRIERLPRPADPIAIMDTMKKLLGIDPKDSLAGAPADSG